MTLSLQDVYAANILDTVRHQPLRRLSAVGVMKTIDQFWFEVVELPEP